MTLLPCPYCGSEVKYGHLTCDMYRKYRHLKSRNQDLSSFTIEELLREMLLRNVGDNNDK